MKIIGICGGSGTGKSTVAAAFDKKGVPVINADLVYREMVSYRSPLLLKLADEFGNDIISQNGSLDRKKLSEIVFKPGNESKLQKLNSITLNSIIEETEHRIRDLEKQNHSAVVYDAPLLFESGFNEKCDVIIAVIASDDVRIERIMQRDSLTEEQARARISRQLSNDFLAENANYTLVNNGSESELMQKVDLVAEKILNEV